LAVVPRAFWPHAAIPKAPLASITLEANPDDAAKFEALAAVGIGRISIGVQSLNDRHLKTLGRTHSAAAAKTALEAAARNFKDVNADLIFGIPQQSVEELLADAQVLLDAGVTHISAYGLTVHEGTLLAKAVRKGEFRPVVDNAEREHFLALDSFLRAHDFEHYEISNYAKPGYRSKHNTLYWTGESYRGFGPSAHSFDAAAGRRFWNLRSYDRWLAAVEAGQNPVEGEEILDLTAQKLERLYLSLRRRAHPQP
jgi:oxygen-independent coproporphyrinogen-3 oxidase